MLNLLFLNVNMQSSGEETHECIGHREGDWIIFTCLECKDYERRYNWKTGEMKVRSGNLDVIHTGSHQPVQVAPFAFFAQS